EEVASLNPILPVGPPLSDVRSEMRPAGVGMTTFDKPPAVAVVFANAVGAKEVAPKAQRADAVMIAANRRTWVLLIRTPDIGTE
ncbi:MAG: hypothetical protein ABSE75_10380, partial [Acidimicrobiales bacterium]